MYFADFKSPGGELADTLAPGGQQLLGRLLTLLHRAANGREFAAAFPEYSVTPTLSMGTVLRVFAQDRETLKGLLADPKLASFVMGQFEFSGVRSVAPKQIVGWVTFSRFRPKSEKYSRSNTERALRRQADGKRDRSVPDYLAARERQSCQLQTPYLRLQSKSRQTEFPLYIQRADAIAPGSGGFDAYGLSRGSATPVLA